MVEVQVDVATTPVVRSKAKPKSKSKPRRDASPSSSTANASVTNSSPRKWSLFHRGNGTSPTNSKKPITLFQSRRRRQKQQNHSHSQNQDSPSTDRGLPINETKTGILRHAGKKPNTKVPASNGTNGKDLSRAAAIEQPAASQADPSTVYQRENDLSAIASQKSLIAADMTTTTEKNELNHWQSSSKDATPVTSSTGVGTDTEGSERAVLIFDREKRGNPSDETLQEEKNVERTQSLNIGKTIGAVLSIVVLFWLVMYLPSKIVEGGQQMLSLYHNFTSRMHTLAHILRVGFTVAASVGTLIGWGYLAKNTRKFIERRRSDLNLTFVNPSNPDAHVADLTDDYALNNHEVEKRNSKASFRGKIYVNNLAVSTTSHDDHTSQIHAQHDHDH